MRQVYSSRACLIIIYKLRIVFEYYFCKISFGHNNICLLIPHSVNEEMKKNEEMVLKWFKKGLLSNKVVVDLQQHTS